ncbi:MAG: hypothetical protein KAR20_23715 [Candidatus Heimdallarchaeota archaeon]|nr:hypothetical protein [Candidatus Heimdallarchaeota archaeon]
MIDKRNLSLSQSLDAIEALKEDLFEIGNQIFVFIELKYGLARLPKGQELAFERLVDTIEENKNAIFIIGIHNCESEIDIDAAVCTVKKYRTRRKWRIPAMEITVKKLADKFIEHCETENVRQDR